MSMYRVFEVIDIVALLLKIGKAIITCIMAPERFTCSSLHKPKIESMGAIVVLRIGTERLTRHTKPRVGRVEVLIQWGAIDQVAELINGKLGAMDEADNVGEIVR